MSVATGPNMVKDGLVLYLDAANTLSFRGKPTTNLVKIESDYTGVAYGPDNQWIDTTIGKQYVPSIPTPIGFGATLLSESSTSGWQALSRFGGGGSGNFCLSAFIRPVDSDLVTIQIGLLGAQNVEFNLQTRQITYNSMPASPRFAMIEDVPSHPGWVRVAANMVGRSGGWVGSIGYRVNAFSSGIGTKRMYITGLQYETTPKPTRYLLPLTSRGTTFATGGGWVDLSGYENHGELFGDIEYESSGGGCLVFDGVNDYAQVLNSPSITFSQNQPNTFEYVLYHKDTNNLTNGGILSKANFFNQYAHLSFSDGLAVYQEQTGSTITHNSANFFLNSQDKWTHIVITYDGSVIRSYKNGVLFSQSPSGKTFNANSNTLYIGSNGGTQYFLLGKISMFKMYNNVISAKDVQQNFNAIRGRYGV